MKNPDKLPCKIDGSDDECWDKVLKDDPPCEDDDEDCWKHFKEVFGDDKKESRGGDGSGEGDGDKKPR